MEADALHQLGAGVDQGNVAAHSVDDEAGCCHDPGIAAAEDQDLVVVVLVSHGIVPLSEGKTIQAGET
ncbi:MAG TPA: hypothetical protein VNW71_23865 [Thermoanaerobaculia bacterium]|nr:hypothetical protein [Thermoanaerobaculia bacterium]